MNINRIAGFAATVMVSGALAAGAIFGTATASASPGPGVCARAHTVEGGACGPTADGARTYPVDSGPGGGLGRVSNENQRSGGSGPSAGDAIGGGASGGGQEAQ